jgi:hypothetical protein
MIHRWDGQPGQRVPDQDHILVETVQRLRTIAV